MKSSGVPMCTQELFLLYLLNMEQKFGLQKSMEDIPLPIEKQRVINDLKEIGKKTGNHIEFKDFGNFSKQGEGLSFNEKALEGLSKDDREVVKVFVDFLDSYQEWPVFLDSFDNDKNVKDLDDKATREGWVRGHLDEEKQKIYNSNRIKQCLKALNPFIMLCDKVVNEEVKMKLHNLRMQIPWQLLKNNEENKKEGNILEYYFLSAEKKVEVEKKFFEIVKDTVALFKMVHNVKEN